MPNQEQERFPTQDLDMLNIHDLWKLQVDIQDSLEATSNRLMDLEEPRNEAEKKEKEAWEAKKQELTDKLNAVSQKIEKRSL